MVLHSPRPQFIAKHVCRPHVVWDYTKLGGDVVQLDRYAWFHDSEPGRESYNKEARTRAATETLGIGGGRNIEKDKEFFVLRETTGPADPSDPNGSGTLSVSIKNLMTAKQRLLDLGNLQMFNDSIGSSRLATDFLMWEDRVYILELLSTSQQYNPNGFADGATLDLSTSGYGGEPPKITVKDLDEILVRLRSNPNNAIPFEDGNFGCLLSSRALSHLKRDPEFQKIAVEVGGLPASMVMMPMQYGPMSPEPPQIQYGATPTLMNGFYSTPYQGGLYAGQTINEQMMPIGFVFNGFRFFVSENIPTVEVTLTYSNATDSSLNGSATRTAENMIFFGQEAVGVAIGGAGPQIKIHELTDFGRHVHLIWQHYGEVKLLQDKFVLVARTYNN